MTAPESAETRRYRLALESLTVGGSEYHKDPERCVAAIRARFELEHRVTIAAKKAEKALQATLEAIRATEATACDRLPDPEEDCDCGGCSLLRARRTPETTHAED